MSGRAILLRIGQAIGVLAAAFTVAFLLLQALPGDATMIKYASPELGLSPEQVAEIRASRGADLPVGQQFLHAVVSFLRGDFGYSTQTGTPVAQLIAVALPATITLAVLGFIVATALALGVAVLATFGPLRALRGVLRNVPSIFIAVPVFWLGIVLVQIFSFQLGLISVIRPGPVEGLILPVLTLAVPISAPIAQVLIRSIDRVTEQPFVTVLRARGASETWLLWRDVLRNALGPAIAIAGVLLGELIAGAVVTETVFGRSGIGRLTVQAVSFQDAPVLQAIVVLSATGFVVVSLLADLAQPLLDPRQRAAAASGRVAVAA